MQRPHRFIEGDCVSGLKWKGIMNDAEDAKKWRLKRAEELVRLFKEDTGLPATSVEALEAWYSSARGKFVVERRGKLLRRKDHSKN